MEKYFVVGLTNEEVGKGGLSALVEIIENEFMSTSRAVIEKKISPPITKNQAIIRFENFLTETDSANEFESYDDILYLNSVAKKLIEDKGLNLNILKEVNTVPENAGCLVSMPIYR